MTQKLKEERDSLETSVLLGPDIRSLAFPAVGLLAGIVDVLFLISTVLQSSLLPPFIELLELLFSRFLRILNNHSCFLGLLKEKVASEMEVCILFLFYLCESLPMFERAFYKHCGGDWFLISDARRTRIFRACLSTTRVLYGRRCSWMYVLPISLASVSLGACASVLTRCLRESDVRMPRSCNCLWTSTSARTRTLCLRRAIRGAMRRQAASRSCLRLAGPRLARAWRRTRGPRARSAHSLYAALPCDCSPQALTMSVALCRA